MKTINLGILIFMLLILCSCEKKITEIVNNNSWNYEDCIQNDQYIINSKIIGDKLNFHTMHSFGLWGLNSGTTNMLPKHSGFYPYSGSHISNNYLFGISFDKKSISVSLIDPECKSILFNQTNQGNPNISMSDIIYPAFLDSTFSEDCTILSSYHQPIVSNGNNQFLFFFYNHSPENQGTFSCLVDISYSEPYPHENSCVVYNIDRFIITKLSDFYNNYIYDTYYYNEKYIFSCEGNKQMDTNGNITDLDIRFSFEDFFEYQDKLWAVSGHHMYNSTDGVNWIDTGYTITPCPDFFEFNGTLCAKMLMTIIEIDFENVKIYKLDNSGLDGHYITAINHNNQTVYISTYGGLYSRPVSDFFKNKQLQTNSKSGDIQLTKR